jgi:hypothetical protein
VLGEVFIEVPGNRMTDAVNVVPVGPLTLRVVQREVVLADRIIGFKHWRATAFGAQAIGLLALFGGSLDETLLRQQLRREDAEDALDALRALAESDEDVGEEQLQLLLQRLHPGS